jgi:hypothetical protein
MSQEHLAEVGAMYGADHVIDGAHTQLTYAAQDEAALAPWGFDAAWRADLAAAVDALIQQRSNRALVDSAARPSGNQAHDSYAALEGWFEHAHTAVELGDPAKHQAAPHRPPHWQRVANIAGAAQTLLDYLKGAAEVGFPGGKAALVQQGQAALEAFRAARTSHQGALAKVSPEVTALHAREGLAIEELKRLAKAARKAVRDRADAYAVSSLRQADRRPRKGDAKPDPAPVAK